MPLNEPQWALAERPRTARSVIKDTLLRHSVSKALFALVAAISVLYVLVLPRFGMIDQANYLQNFIEASDLRWFKSVSAAESWIEYISLFLMEEILWVLWTTVLGFVLEPEIAVYVTVGVLNALVAFAMRDYRNPILALLLWISLPVGFAIIGMYQIRQGLAFGVWLLVAISWRRPVIGAVIASAFHSTFLVFVPISFVVTRKSMPVWLRLFIVVGMCLLGAYVGQAAFEQLGGRRIDVYAFADETFNLRFLISLLVYMTFPLLVLLRVFYRKVPLWPGSMFDLETYSLIYLGLITYLSVCYFLFPLGLYRVNYMAMLGLIPIVGNADFSALRRGRLPAMSVVLGLGPVLAFLVYQVLKAATENRYVCAIMENCVVLVGL